MRFAIMSERDLSDKSSFSLNTSFKSPVNSSVNSFANLPSFPSINAFICSWIISGFGSLNPPLGASSPGTSSAFSLGLKSLKKSPNPSIVSFIFSCKSVSFIDENIFKVSPKLAVSLTDPNTVNNNNCRYFHIDVLVFSLIPSQLNKSLKSTSGKNMTFKSDSDLNMSAFEFIISKNRSGNTAIKCWWSFSYSASSAVNQRSHRNAYSGKTLVKSLVKSITIERRFLSLI